MPRSRLANAALAAALAIQTGAILAQEEDEEASTIEEVVVVGSHIPGAQISDALPVTIISEEDIEALGVQSGDELLEFVAEQGQNYGRAGAAGRRLLRILCRPAQRSGAVPLLGAAPRFEEVNPGRQAGGLGPANLTDLAACLNGLRIRYEGDGK